MTFKNFKILPLVPKSILVIYCFIKKLAGKVMVSTMYCFSSLCELAQISEDQSWCLSCSCSLLQLELVEGDVSGGRTSKVASSLTYQCPHGLSLSPCFISFTRSSP